MNLLLTFINASAALMDMKHKLSAKREYYDEKGFLKADRALGGLG